MSQAATIARPYAQAAFEYAQTDHALSTWQEALERLAEAVGFDEIKMIYRNPEVSRKDFISVLAALLKIEDNTPIYNFVRLLVTNKRLLVAPEISARFMELQHQSQDLMDVNVTTVVPMNDHEKARLGKRLQERLGRQVALHCQTQEDLLGGMIVQYGDKVIDTSLRAQIQRLARDLTVQTEVK